MNKKLSNLKKELADNKIMNGFEKEVVLSWIDRAYACGLDEGGEIARKSYVQGLLKDLEEELKK